MCKGVPSIRRYSQTKSKSKSASLSVHSVCTEIQCTYAFKNAKRCRMNCSFRENLLHEKELKQGRDYRVYMARWV